MDTIPRNLSPKINGEMLMQMRMKKKKMRKKKIKLKKKEMKTRKKEKK